MKATANWTSLCCLLFLVTPALAAATQYKGVELYRIAPYAMINDISAGDAVGSTLDSAPQALLWTSPHGAPVNLQPTNLVDEFYTTYAVAIEGGQQVGRGDMLYGTRALLWNGSANSTVNLHPTNLNDIYYSAANGTNGTQQVGVGYSLSVHEYHALLWHGTADSAVDLHPTLLSGISYSNAIGTDGVSQVGNGYGAGTNYRTHALLWSGTAESAINLQPTHLPGISNSVAVSVSANQQVGFGWDPFAHALLWHGTADSAVDLHPAQFGEFSDSEAKDTNGFQQVGTATYFSPSEYRSHAMLWYGTAESAVDLHFLLPAGFTRSEAYSINQQGTIYGIAYDSNQLPHAVMWTPMLVPEPGTVTLVLVGVLAVGLRGRRKQATR